MAALACSFRRLHITPFTPELEDRIIAPALKHVVKDISFHCKPTFPEKGFGFVEMPAAEAEKLKKKFHGATLRGQKVKIEEAKLLKRKSDEEDEGAGKKRVRRDKKAREDGVLPGVELDEGRSVKRGWTDEGEGSQRSKRKPSQSLPAESQIEGKRLRFKTTVPANVAAVEDQAVKKKKGKESKNDKKVVVEEFGKSKRTLVSSDIADVAHGETTYEDGKGWVDQNGNVVEAERPSKRPSRKKAAKDAEPTVGAIESTETNEPIQDDNMAVEAEIEGSIKAAEAIDETAKEVHPLEAIFKRPTSSSSNSSKPRPKAIDTSFSFFNASTAEEDADTGMAVPPKTPNTRRDLEWRSIRSAAPTPDTAAIGRKFSFPFASGNEADEDDSEDGDAEMNEAEAGASQTAGGEESKFRKWFYEHRGEFNRGWKKRRREEKKQMRQRENRRLSKRVA